ncbi:Histone-fold protein [Cordyceps fumosorosea ARSEF 2679]|uniref:Histone-fold protein n=1 Tax=Cordyceps fumosorosea (strain ARSEF 2679) TaxID=1081104 RepID=A0A168AJP0_CORFA|nr:Histone-fold protein [Cordyceps fumosorosea ARSEF 2679]OAA68841.1 Histone-fold protein [Cordyceps fumosorosea ARSEF 2679]
MPYNTTAIPPRKEPTGQTQLPLSRVKKIIGQDPDVAMCSNNAAFVITLAAEMFIQHLANEAHTQAKLDKKPRKNIQYKDVANAVAHQDSLEFLEDTVPKTIPFKKAMALAKITQARLRGENVTSDEGLQSTQDAPPNGNGNTFVNGDRAAFSVALRSDDRYEPNDQLELEMRQAAEPRNHDVRMGGQ